MGWPTCARHCAASRPSTCCPTHGGLGRHVHDAAGAAPPGRPGRTQLHAIDGRVRALHPWFWTSAMLALLNLPLAACSALRSCACSACCWAQRLLLRLSAPRTGRSVRTGLQPSRRAGRRTAAATGTRPCHRSGTRPVRRLHAGGRSPAARPRRRAGAAAAGAGAGAADPGQGPQRPRSRRRGRNGLRPAPTSARCCGWTARSRPSASGPRSMRRTTSTPISTTCPISAAVWRAGRRSSRATPSTPPMRTGWTTRSWCSARGANYCSSRRKPATRACCMRARTASPWPCPARPWVPSRGAPRRQRPARLVPRRRLDGHRASILDG